MDNTLELFDRISAHPDNCATIAYMNKEGVARVRTISGIHAPRMSKDGHYYIRAHDDFRSGPRTFVLDRIQPLAFWHRPAHGTPSILRVQR